MEFYETDTGRLGMREIPATVAQLLLEIPRWTDHESEEAEQRIFPPPASADLEQVNADWRAHVEPGLHEFFQSNRDTVEADLRGLTGERDTCAVEFSRAHAEPWLNALSQARLALAAAYEFSGQDLERSGPPEITTNRELALFQIHLYAMIQGWLLDILDDEATE
jgi:hypothetical protein